MLSACGAVWICFKLIQSRVQILSNDQSWIFVKKRFPCTSEMHDFLLRFFFGTTKKVWPAISITELQKASRVAPIPAGRRRGVVARELADRLLELATRYIYACDFRPETCSILLQHFILREWNRVLGVFNRQKITTLSFGRENWWHSFHCQCKCIWL